MELDGKESVNFWRREGSGLLEIAAVNFKL